MLKFEQVNQVYYKINWSNWDELQRFKSAFSSEVENARFMPLVRSGKWNGKINLIEYDKKTRQNYLPTGLLAEAQQYCNNNNIQNSFSDLRNGRVSKEKMMAFIQEELKTLPFKPYDYQLTGFFTALDKLRTTLVSVTGSGKSLIIYLLAKFLTQTYGGQLLLIVPSLSLISQMKADFITYSGNEEWVESIMHQVYSGQEKESDKQIVLSTWQSIHRLDKEYFEKFKYLIIDEVHQVSSVSIAPKTVVENGKKMYKTVTTASIKKILEKTVNAKVRIGTTGTLSDDNLRNMTITGYLGSPVILNTTKELSDKNILADLKIVCNVLKYDSNINTIYRATIDGLVEKECYRAEVDFLTRLKERNAYIAKLALATEKNTLILFTEIEHGLTLLNMLNKQTKKKVYYIDGSIDKDTRESIRLEMEKEQNIILIASYGTFSTGINVKKIYNIIFASSTKSKIRVLQSIGRGLRKKPDVENTCYLYDIVDDLSVGNWKNYSYKHFLNRINFYEKNHFDYRIENITI